MNAHKHHLALALTIAIPLFSASAHADFTNGPDPYAPGFGFDRPHEAAWGGWTRGTPGTLYAEWDTFVDASHGGTLDRTAAPGWARGSMQMDDGPAVFNPPGADIAPFGVTSATHLGWNPGYFRAGSGNLYSFTVAPQFTALVQGAVGAAPATRVALQIETWGQPLNGPMTLNGLAPNVINRAVTFTRPDHPSVFGPVLLEHLLFLWDLPQTGLPSATDNFVFSFGATHSHLTLAQVAVDIAPVPIPPALALLGSALAGLGVIGRRKTAAQSVH